MRYTEVRMQRVTEELLEDLEKDTVDMLPNYDGTLSEPTVLPARLPNLFLNGSSGIAVGMATNIPPHNLKELCEGIDYYIQHRDDCTIDDLMNFVKGPDFPTGATICGHNGIAAMYKNGRGQLTVRGKAEIEHPKDNKERIIITEIPYGVNKTDMLKHMVELVKDKVIAGISDIRDESKRDIRIVIDVKRDAMGEVVLNHLYKHTQLQTTFGAIMLAIVDGRPKVLSLKEYFKCYVDHRFDVITRRTVFELNKAEARKHILEGLLLAISNLDEVVSIIRSSKTRQEAKDRLQERFKFTDNQVNAILEMRLYQLVGLEQERLEAELAELLKDIAEYKAILADPEKVYAIIREDLSALKESYATKGPAAERRTQIVADVNEVSIKDLVPDEPCVITLSNRGYVKRVPLAEYKEQRRGGFGVRGAQVKDQDFIRLVFVANTHDEIMFFTNTGRLFVKGAYEILEAQKTAFGRPLINILNLQEGEQVLQLLPIRSFEGDLDVIFATKNGTIKKTLLSEYQNVNRAGIRAINIDEGDELVGVRLAKPEDEILMITANGVGIKFASSEVRRMGRTATGVRGVKLRDSDIVVSIDICDSTKTLLVATENGYGKRTEFSEYRTCHRGGFGVTAIKGAERNGKVVSAHAVAENESIISISSDSQTVRSPVSQIGVVGRSAQGVRLVRLSAGAKLVSVSVCEGAEEVDDASQTVNSIEPEKSADTNESETQEKQS
jgi:DNA gyrase subunit A